MNGDNQKIKIRLASIDCPEKKQPFGDRAKQTTGGLCHEKQVEILKTGEDRYQRPLRFVIADGINVNAELVRLGYAWHYKDYSDDTRLGEIESASRESRRGLWNASEAPVAPWKWRKR